MAASLKPFDPKLEVVRTTSASADEARKNLVGSESVAKVWHTVPKVLNNEQCEKYKKQLDQIFAKHKINPGPTGRAVRDHSDEQMNKEIFELIRPHLPSKFQGRELLGPHPLMRVMRYKSGGHLSPHIDGTLKDERDSQISFLTAFLYLNDDFKGGGTRFYRKWKFADETFTYKGEGIVDLMPQKGMLNLFQHDFWHQGLPAQGIKYGIRVMIKYKLEQNETFDSAKVTHIWVPER